MVATAKQFRKALSAFLNKEADWNSDNIYIALLGAGYTPNFDVDDYWNDVSANEVTGTGYTANGQLLTSCTITFTAANSWGTVHATSTAFAANDVVRPSAGNGYLYRAKVAGTTAGSAPTFPTTIGSEVSDGGVTWENVGPCVTVLDCADPSWASSTITAQYGVVYDRSPSTDATRPLILLLDLGSALSSISGTFALPINAQGLMMFFAYQ